jgi:catalase
MAELEHVPPGEADRIDNVVKLTVAQMTRRYLPDNPVLRGVHPKDHGCVSATFQVHDSLPPELCVGVFATPGRSYEALIRFSNASVLVAPDAIGSRGMAVKLKGVGVRRWSRRSWAETRTF